MSATQSSVSILLDTKSAVFILLILFAILFLQVAHSLFLSPTRNVPGPVLARFTRLWELWVVNQGQSHLKYIELHGKHGKVVRVAPNRFSINDPEYVKPVYALGTKFAKSKYYLDAGDPENVNIFSIKDNQEHAEKRRKVASLYSMSTLIAYEEAVDRMTSVLMGKFRQFADSQIVVNIPRFVQFYAFDVIGEITFDQNFGMMQQEGDIDNIIENIHAGIGYQARVGLFPEFHRWVMKLTSLLPGESPVAALIRFVDKQIDTHLTDGLRGHKNPKSESFLQKMLAMDAASKVDKRSYYDVIGSNIGAGSDTTAITLSALFYYINKNPSVLEKLRQEIEDGVKEGTISDPITFKESQDLVYLQAVIKETLRLHPAVGTILPRVVPKGGITLGGIFFPEGSEIGANAWCLSYNTDIYGNDVHDFRPERWLEKKTKDESHLHESMNFAFGSGARVCLGKNISLLELNKVVPQVIRHYDFELVKPTHEMKTRTAWFVHPSYECVIRNRI